MRYELSGRVEGIAPSQPISTVWGKCSIRLENPILTAVCDDDLDRDEAIAIVRRFLARAGVDKGAAANWQPQVEARGGQRATTEFKDIPARFSLAVGVSQEDADRFGRELGCFARYPELGEADLALDRYQRTGDMAVLVRAYELLVNHASQLFPDEVGLLKEPITKLRHGRGEKSTMTPKECFDRVRSLHARLVRSFCT